MNVGAVILYAEKVSVRGKSLINPDIKQSLWELKIFFIGKENGPGKGHS